MIQFHSISHRKIFLIGLVLVLFSTMLVAQKNDSAVKPTLPMEKGESITSDESKFQTYTGEEYLIYRKGDQMYSYDPETGESKSVPGSITFGDPRIYIGNLGSQVYVSERIETNLEGTEFRFPKFKQTAQNGNVIISVLGEPAVVSVSGYPNFILNPDPAIGITGNNYFLNKNPIAWIDQTHLLISKGEVDLPIHGVFVVDIATGKEVEVLKATTYYDIKMSPSSKYLMIRKVGPGGIKDELHDGRGPSSLAIYDFANKRFKTITEDAEMIGWTTIKQISHGPGEPGFFTSSAYTGNCMLGGLTYKLPFDCGQAYRVSRDGSNSTPTECGLLPGSTAYIGGGAVNPHGNPSIDFTDQGVGGTTEDHLPIRAAAYGFVSQAGWQNQNITTCTELAYAGQRVVITHSDGTYTLYGHMSAISVVVGQMVAQGQQLGLEGHTGHCEPCDFEHIHFQRATSSSFGSTSVWTQFAELANNCTPTKGYIYQSQNGSCQTPCINGGILPTCGGTFSAQSTIGSDTRATYFVTTATGGNLATVNLSGPEKIYQITPIANGIMSVKITNSTMHNVIILSGNTCSNLNTLFDCKGTAGTSSNSYTATCNVSAGTTYYIVVDGLSGSSGSFTLTVTPPCPLPNLTDNGSSKSNSGRNLTLSIKVANNGGGNAGAFVTRIWLSTDTYLENGNDYYIAFVNYPNGLQSFYANNANGTITVPGNVPSGTYYVLEKIDYLSGNWNGAVAETSESDNAFYIGSPFYLPPSFTDQLDDRSDNHNVSELIPDTASFEVFQPSLNNVTPISTTIDVFNTCTASTYGLEISATNVTENSEYFVVNLLGQTVCSSKTDGNEVRCSVPVTGIYSLTIISPTGERCSQKIFVK